MSDNETHQAISTAFISMLPPVGQKCSITLFENRKKPLLFSGEEPEDVHPFSSSSQLSIQPLAPKVPHYLPPQLLNENLEPSEHFKTQSRKACLPQRVAYLNCTLPMFSVHSLTSERSILNQHSRGFQENTKFRSPARSSNLSCLEQGFNSPVVWLQR